MAIVVTGNPGVGKHTVARGVGGELGMPVLDINEAAKNAGLLEMDGGTGDVDTAGLRKALEGRISGSVVVGHLAPYVVEKGEIEAAAILRRSPYDLVSVYGRRGYADAKARENVGGEILGIVAHDAVDRFGEKAFQVDVSKKSVKKTTEYVLAAISGGSAGEDVDWLELVAKNGDLEKFL